ncbi:DMT family transporter [Candidatus Latescibacterota bacterium]
MKKQNQAYVYAALAVLFWSTVASAFKISLRYLTSLDLVLYSSLVSSTFLFIVLSAGNKLKLLLTYSLREYVHSALLGFLNPFLYYVVLFKAYSLLPAQTAQPLNWTWPLMLVILSAPMLKQKIDVKNITAIIISFAGVLIISTRGNILNLSFSNRTGVFLALGSSVIWALFWIFNIKDRRDETAKLFLNFSFGFVYTLIAIISFSTVEFPNIRGFAGAAYVGLFEMGMAFVVWMKALNMTKTTALVGNLIYMAPFLSLIVIYLVLGEKIHFSTIIGLIFIISGILFQQYASRNS